MSGLDWVAFGAFWAVVAVLAWWGFVQIVKSWRSGG